MSSKLLGKNTSPGDDEDKNDSVEEEDDDENKVRCRRWKISLMST